jgi:glucose/arabinose dehydrogenase
MLSRCLLPILLASAATGACQDAPQVAPSGETKITVTTVASGLSHPWSLAFLPDGRMLVTERPGRLRYVTREGALSDPITGLPEVYAEGQGGLLDVILDPAFEKNSTIYISYAEPAAGDTNGTAVARARLDGGRLTDLKVIFRQQPKSRARIISARDWYLRATATCS